MILLCCTVESRAAAQSMTPSGNPPTLSVVTAPGAGSAPTPVTSASTTYSLGASVTNGRKITASINSPMPAGMTLEVQVAAPSGGTSSGFVSLTTTAASVATNLQSSLGSSGHVISYRFTATAGAGRISATSRTVTFSIVAGP